MATNATQDCVIDNIHSIRSISSDNNTSNSNIRNDITTGDGMMNNFTNMGSHVTLLSLKDKLFNADSPC